MFEYESHEFTSASSVEVSGIPLGEPGEHETYHLLGHPIDAWQAFEIIRDEPREPVQVDPWDIIRRTGYPVDEEEEPVQDYDRIVKGDYAGEEIGLIGHVDWDALPHHVNEELAGIAAKIRLSVDGPADQVLIDGHHRAGKAWAKGKSYFVYQLRPSETFAACPQLLDRFEDRLRRLREGIL
jgi:hypothetical protein